jgi:hypothetical protein
MRSTGALATALLIGALQGCAAGPVPRGPAPTSARPEELLIPSGYGSLRQEQITLTLETGELQLKVTPLEEWVTRLTAPDTWTRLSGLGATHREEAERRLGGPVSLFLVSFFTRVPGTPFRPDDVELVHRGRRLRPLLIRPVTSGWGAQRLEAQETQVAVYAFAAELDLQQPLTVEYGLESATGWDEILRLLEAERGRARARAGLDAPGR